ncbi:MAG: AAA family ATPase [Duganella sp.]
MKLPRFRDVVKEKDQLAVYEHSPYESMLVSGPPGSGKTSMAIWRALTLVDDEHKLSVVLITRGRLLTAIASHLGKEQSARIETNTMHSFVSSDFGVRFGGLVPKLPYGGGYNWDWDAIIVNYERAKVVPTLDHLIIDEAQNLPLKFFEWAIRFGSKKISIFADEHQTTLSSGASVGDISKLGFPDVYTLLHNHRNTANISKVVGHFHVNRVVPQAMPIRGNGDVPYVLTVNNWETFADAVANRVLNRRESVGVICYGTADVEHMTQLLESRLKGQRVDWYTNEKAAGDEFGIQMREYGVTVLSGESAIGLEFDSMFLQDLDRSLPTDSPIKCRRLYMLCARARDTLVLVNGPQGLSQQQLDSLPKPPILTR